MPFAALILLFAESWDLPTEWEACEEETSFYVIEHLGDRSYQIEWAVADSFADAPTYFPVGATDHVSCSWYRYMFGKLGEERLTSDAGGSAFRFTWLRSFHAPYIFRVEPDRNPGAFVLHWTRIDSAGSMFEVGGVDEAGQVRLSQSQVDQFNTLKNALNICDAEPEPNSQGSDGSDWLFETATSSQYCLMSRWSPARAGPAAQLGYYLMDLAGVPAENRY